MVDVHMLIVMYMSFIDCYDICISERQQCDRTLLMSSRGLDFDDPGECQPYVQCVCLSH